MCFWVPKSSNFKMWKAVNIINVSADENPDRCVLPGKCFQDELEAHDNASNICSSWVLEPHRLLSFLVALPENGCFIASGLVEKVCFWSNRLGVVLGEIDYSHSIWLILTLRSQCNLPFDISDWFSRAPLQEVWGNNWIFLKCAHALLTVFSESMMSAMQMFHLWHWEIMGNRDGIQIGVIIARLHHSWLWSPSGWRWQAFSVPHQNVRMPFSAPLMFSWLFLMVF